MLKFLFQSGGAKPQITLLGQVEQGSNITKTQKEQNLTTSYSKISYDKQSNNQPQAQIINEIAKKNTKQIEAGKIEPPPIRATPTQQLVADKANMQILHNAPTNIAANIYKQTAQILPQSSAPEQTVMNNIILSQSVISKLKLLPGQIVSAKVSGKTSQGAINFIIGQQAFSAFIGADPPIGTILQFVVRKEGRQYRLVLNNILQNSLLQTNDKNIAIGKVSSAEKTNNPVTAPITSPTAQALFLSLPMAIARQDSIFALFANLLNLQKEGFSTNKAIPQNIRNIAQSLLSGQLKFDIPISGEALRGSILRSGIFLEGILSGKSGSQLNQLLAQKADIKSLLLALRNSLVKWQGEQYGPNKPDINRPPPPIRGPYPRSQLPKSKNLANMGDVKSLSNSLLSQTDAALARIKLFQISSLQDNPTRLGTNYEINLELPFSYGSENNIIRFQIFRDTNCKNNNIEDSGWNMRFSMNIAQMGEVGANISYMAGKIGALIWAEKYSTANRLNKFIPSLLEGLQARGLEINFVRIKHGIPDNEAKSSGEIMDNKL